MQDFKYKPGIYFGMTDTEYHRIPCLSASGIKNMMISPMDFWANSWMNPDREDDSDKKHFMDGKAYHCRVLEGLEVFTQHYARGFDSALYPDAYDGSDEIKERLRELKEGGIKEIKVSGNKPELIAQLLQYDESPQILDVLQRDYEAGFKGVEFIDPKTYDQIMRAASMIEKHPDLSKCFSAGYPEVVIVWYCPEHKVYMKSMIDYLKSQAFIEFKTFANINGMSIDRAIYSHICNRKYDVSIAAYCMAIEKAKEYVKAGHVFRLNDYQVDSAWLDRFANADRHQAVMVFQQKGNAPVARGKIFQRTTIFDCAELSVKDNMYKFRQYFDTFGTDPWIDTCGIERLEDEYFPIYMTQR